MGLTDKGNVAYSMDNPRLFGKIAHEYAMREAISDGVITDYKILAITVSKEDVMKFLNPTVGKSGVKHFSQDVMESAAKILAITSASEKYDLKSALVFNSTIKDSEEFVRNFEAFYKDKDFNIGHIDGFMNNETREKQVNILKKDGFSILSNAKLLGEGHDIPQTDFVVFNNKVKSKTNIVQYIGRVQRLDDNNFNKVGHILLPIFIDDVNQDLEEALRTNDGLQTLFNTVNSLKESDTQLRDWISTRKKIREERKDSGKNIFDTNDKIVFTDMARLRAEIEQTREQKINDDKKAKPIILDAHKASEKEIDLKYQEMIEKWEDKVEATLVGERWQLEESWNNTFDLVKEYYEANGKLPSRTLKDTEIAKLGRWIDTQKQAYKNKTLEASRVERLLELDAEILVTKDLEEAWNNGFELVKEYYEANGKLPSPYSKDTEIAKLGRWIDTQKETYKANTLKASRVERLLELDVEFFMPKVTRKSNSSPMSSGINNELIDTNDSRVKAALALKETVDAMVNKSSSAMKVNSKVDTKDSDDVKTASAVSNTVRRNRR